jgi:hypothetical protein
MSAKKNKNMSTGSLLSIKLSKPAQRALAAAGISKPEQFSKFSEDDVKKMHGIGPNAMKEIKKMLAVNGLSFLKR